MRAIESSPWVEKPSLVEIHATTAGGARMSEFTLNLSLKKQAPATTAAPAKTPAAPAKTVGAKG